MSRTYPVETTSCGSALAFERVRGFPCLYGATLARLGLARAG